MAKKHTYTQNGGEMVLTTFMRNLVPARERSRNTSVLNPM